MFVPHLALLLGAWAVWAALSGNYIFDRVLPGRFAGLYMLLFEIQMGLFFAIGLTGLCWYWWSLNELKRECFAAQAASDATSP